MGKKINLSHRYSILRTDLHSVFEYLNRAHIYHVPALNSRVNGPIFEYSQYPIPKSPDSANQMKRECVASIFQNT